MIARAIRAARMSQGEFSRKLGVAPSVTSRVINGERDFGLKYIAAIADILGLTLEELLP